jgi:hypothetical protein
LPSQDFGKMVPLLQTHRTLPKLPAGFQISCQIIVTVLGFLGFIV